MREQMMDEDPAKREAWSAESSALIYTTITFNTTYKTYRSKRRKLIKCSRKIERNT